MEFDKSNLRVLKKMYILGLKMSDEVVKVPKECDGLIIKQRVKKGTGHIDLVIPVSYKFKSGDMFFLSNRGLVRLINTDTKQAIKIAEIVKEEFNRDYKLL